MNRLATLRWLTDNQGRLVRGDAGNERDSLRTGNETEEPETSCGTRWQFGSRSKVT